jgi:hypothetical protein
MYKTVVILGAGAHYPYGFPIMKELKDEIITNLSIRFPFYPNDPNSAEALRQSITNFIKKFKLSPINSIDLYLTLNANVNNFPMIGKSAIFLRLLQKEYLFKVDKYKKVSDNSDKKKMLDDDWFNIIFNYMINSRKGLTELKYFQHDNITFITFNYDRLLEFLFLRSLQNTYTANTEDEIFSVFSKIKILHVYGSLGDYYPDAPNYLDFGNTTIGYNSEGIKFIKNIKLINERNQEPNNSEIIDVITRAERIYFLGFSYQNENLEILNIPKSFTQKMKVYGTALSFFKEERDRIETRMTNTINPKMEIYIQDCNCCELLKRYFDN